MLVFWNKFPAANKVLPLTCLLTFILGWSKVHSDRKTQMNFLPIQYFLAFKNGRLKHLKKKKKILFRYYPQFFPRVKVKEFSVSLASL